MPKINATAELTAILEKAEYELVYQGCVTRYTRFTLKPLFELEPYDFVEVSQQPLRILEQVLALPTIDRGAAQAARDAIATVLGAFRAADKGHELYAQRVSAGLAFFGDNVQYYEEYLRACIAEEARLDSEIMALEKQVYQLEQ